MLRKKSECKVEERVAMRNGPGTVLIRNIASRDELYDKARMFGVITLNKDCGIGYHEHHNESEIFCIQKGKAIYRDDDKEYEVSEGDVVICEDGHGHGIRNENEDACEFMALIVLK